MSVTVDARIDKKFRYHQQTAPDAINKLRDNWPIVTSCDIFRR